MSWPNLQYEKEAESQGYRSIAGIDEVGRGCIAGPVAAAAVIIPWGTDISWATQVRDSKQLSSKKRQFLAPLIQATSISVAVGTVSSWAVDTWGIVEATRLAMFKAIEQLSCSPDFLLIDALALPDIPLPQRSIIHGDELSLSIACASIVAKVARDQHMIEMDEEYPGYHLDRHKGYGTKEHLLNLQKLGPCPIHRRTFAPLRQQIELQGH